MTFSMLRSAVAIGISACLYTTSVDAQLDPLSVQIQPLAQSSLLLDIANAGDKLAAVGQRAPSCNSCIVSINQSVFFRRQTRLGCRP